jgi:hypothetical protein
LRFRDGAACIGNNFSATENTAGALLNAKPLLCSEIRSGCHAPPECRDTRQPAAEQDQGRRLGNGDLTFE